MLLLINANLNPIKIVLNVKPRNSFINKEMVTEDGIELDSAERGD